MLSALLFKLKASGKRSKKEVAKRVPAAKGIKRGIKFLVSFSLQIRKKPPANETTLAIKVKIRMNMILSLCVIFSKYRLTVSL